MKILFQGLMLLFALPSFSQTEESFSVYFDFDRYSLTKKTGLRLDSFLRSNKVPNVYLNLELNGFCDNKGSDNYNYTLSDKRVASVKNYLLKRGINIELILNASGFGESSPLNENKTEQERQLNRRVDIIIIKSISATVTDKEETISLKKKIADTATTTGTNIVLRNINFVGGMHQFLYTSTPMLEELLDAMKTYPKLVIRIEGHICCQELKGDGMDMETGLDNLSQARAKAVYDYLIENGIASDRLSYKGFGHSVPLYPYPEKTEEERTENRRVEIKILKK